MKTMSKAKIEKLSDSELKDLLRAAENEFDKKHGICYLQRQNQGWN